MPNPIIKGFFADPDIACFNGKFYLYPTTDGHKDWGQASFEAFSSTDLVNWKHEGVVLDLADVPWSEGKKAWAPAIGEKNGKYYENSHPITAEARKDLNSTILEAYEQKLQEEQGEDLDEDLGQGQTM